MSKFPDFAKIFGLPEKRESPAPGDLSRYGKELPRDMIEVWAEFGFSRFRKGLVWIINPALLEDVISSWLKIREKEGRPIPVVRTGFGSTIYWHEAEFYLLDVHLNQKFELGDNVEVLFEIFLCKEKTIRSVLDEPLFKAALKKHGELDKDEIFAFALPLAAGGALDIANVEKVKIREHLEILATVHQGQ